MNDEFQPPQTPYKFSPEEWRVLQQCNSEAFYQRSLPLSAFLGGGTYYAVKAGFLQPNSRFGAVPKVIVAVIAGYFIGKVSYQPICAEKFMALPNSQLGAMLRNRKRKGGYQESMTMDSPGMNKALSDLPSSETYSDVPPSSMDLDTDRPQSGGIDDVYHPTFDESHIEDDIALPPPQQRTTTYEDLRKKNREEYELKRTKPYRGVLTPDEVPSALRTRETDRTSSYDIWNRPPPSNVYGDIWEK